MKHDRHGVPKVVATVVLVVLVVGSLSAAQTFRARVDTVQVTVTVVDAEGRLITGLTKDDFLIFEDDIPQAITQFTDERVPVSLGVLLDASDSMKGQPIVDARAAVDRFVGGLLESRGVQPQATAGRGLDAAAARAARQSRHLPPLRRYGDVRRADRLGTHVRTTPASTRSVGGRLGWRGYGQ